MGASAALGYAGAEPERVTALVCVDALGPPDTPAELAPERYAAWLGDLERVRQRVRGDVDVAAAAAALRLRFPELPGDAARHLVEHGTRDEGGRRRWKFDPLHQTTSPQPYYVAQARAFWRRIACPVLYVEGGQSRLRLAPADATERLAALRAERVTIEGAGHHPHLERAEPTAAAILAFLRRALDLGG
jgi:pimeloyl-ACP methyl ester carboxylesterase